MAFVPVIVGNRRNRYYRNRASGGILAVVIFCLLLGIFFWFFFDIAGGFTLIPIWIFIIGFMLLFIIIGTIAAVASSMSSSTQNIKNEHMKHMNSIEKQEQALLNPYVVQNSSQKQYGEFVYQQVKKEIPVISDVNYCRYCGEKIDRDAKFCHQCGIRL